MTTPAVDPLLTTDDLAALLKVPVGTVRIWRQRKRGPRVTRVGRHARYRRADVEAWLDQQASNPR